MTRRTNSTKYPDTDFFNNPGKLQIWLQTIAQHITKKD